MAKKRDCFLWSVVYLTFASLWECLAEQDYNYFANFSSKEQLQKLMVNSPPGLSRHGWEFVIPPDASSMGGASSEPYWRSCDDDVTGHHSQLMTDWISTNQIAGGFYETSDSIKPKLQLWFTTWCEDRASNINCNGNRLKLRVESKNQVGDTTATAEEFDVEVSSRHQMQSEGSYLRPQTFDLPAFDGSSFRLSLFDDNLCIKIGSIEVFSYVCKEEVVELSLFSKTTAPFDQPSVEVLGQCVPNAEDEQIRSGSLVPGTTRTCTTFGSWQDTFSMCKCLPGFEPNSAMTACNECKHDHYKSTFDNSRCLKCPLNSESFPGESECRCRAMFYKEVNEPPSMSCATTPSEPRDLRASIVGSTFVRLSWLPPWTDGGRSEVKYVVQCEECFPSKEYHTESSNFTMRDLMPDTRLTFRVFATNSVSQFFHDISYEQISVQTAKEVAPANVRFLGSMSHNPNTVALTWDTPKGHSGSAYCLEMKSLSQPKRSALNYCFNGTSFLRSGVQAGQYQFRVAVNFPDGSKGVYSNAISGTVLEGGSGQLLGEGGDFDSRQLIAVMAIVMTISVLILILCVGMACLYRKHNMAASSFLEQQQVHQQQQQSYFGYNTAPNAQYHTYNTLSAKIPIGQAFIEPNFYGEPEMMLAEFVKEIPDKWLQVETQLAALGDESLWSGKLVVPNQQPIDVSVKTITHELSSPGSFSQHKMAVEASTMAQFNHPHVLLLHGMIFSPSEWTLVSECSQRVTLETVVMTPSTCLSPLHVVHILRGISAGMRYLSDLGYVHKVLTSRTVFMGDHLVFKIGGFDLRALLEEENNTTYAKNQFISEIHDFLIPWSAPEVIQARKYSTASDVWSFGVLIWQCLSAGEMPFGACSSEEICEMVTKGQKMNSPKGCPNVLANLIMDCWKFSRQARPPFSAIQNVLENIIRQPYSIDYQATSSTSAKSCDSPKSENGSTLKLKSFDTVSLTGNHVPAVAVSDWLKKLGLYQYCDLFKNNGYMYVHELQGMDLEFLVQIGVSSGKHRKKLLSSLASFHQQQSASPQHSAEASHALNLSTA